MGNDVSESAVIRLATIEDVPAWLEIAKQVEPLFGPMPDIETHIRRAIDHGTALVVIDRAKEVVGAALLSRDDQPHRIHWLAVRAESRRAGIGSSLLQAIIERWDDGQLIDVITFGADVSEGEAARALYRAHGFVFLEHHEDGPEGGSRERWIRH